ncbi:MAG: pirin family protein [Burkholderiales bacterium]|nr:pirin family protein [Burkholderiales bacterium]
MPHTLLAPHVRDIGGFTVRRCLPAAAVRLVGPFIFFDHMGPARFDAGHGIDVRPHPHIGLATVTYLFDGAIQHRDSLGVAQRIAPGDVNWMTAGSGIVHSERTPDDLRSAGSGLHGIQTWVALPRDLEETAPTFTHIPARELPTLEAPGVALRLIAGTGFGLTAPTPVLSSTLYATADLAAGACLGIPTEHVDRAIYVVEGDAQIDGQPVVEGQMLVLEPGSEIDVRATTATRVMILGGAPLHGERFIWWNFVSSTRERIEAAKQRWRDGAFAAVPGETEFIPLPE